MIGIHARQGSDNLVGHLAMWLVAIFALFSLAFVHDLPEWNQSDVPVDHCSAGGGAGTALNINNEDQSWL